MPKRKIKCPRCNNQITIDTIPGEKTFITCPECGLKGRFKTPKEKTKIKPVRQNRQQKPLPIIVKNLTKKFNGFTAVDSVSFDVKKQEIFGFLGPNGAGKTTTIKSILSLINPNHGQVKLNGFNIKEQPKKAKKKIGYLPEKVAFYNNLTALQNLHFYAEMKNISKKDSIPLLKELGLKKAVNKKVGKFSKGMIQRLGVARALLGKPSLVILDEPTGGLDPRGVALIRDKIRQLKKQGTTVFLSSHILAEVQEVCDRIGIINKGKLVAQDSVKKLSEKLKLKPRIKLELEKITDKIIDNVKKVDGVEKVEVKDNNLNVICEPKTKSKVIIAIEKADGEIKNIQTQEISLEEVFLKYTQEEI